MKSKGSALVDYIIPTAVVGLVIGLTLYHMLSSGLLGNFMAASADMKLDFNNDQGIIGDGGDFSDSSVYAPVGSPENPVKTCAAGTCTIIYGEYVLRGIPDDFTNLVETTGTASGTETLLSMIDQMANQLDDPATTMDEGSEIRDLANLGHFISDYESKIESVTDSCKLQADPFGCMQSNFWVGVSPISTTIPTDIEHILTSYSTAATSYGSQSNSFLDFGRATYSCNLGTCDTTSSPVNAFYSTYNNIMNDTNMTYTDATKGLIKELYQDVVLMGDELSLKVDNAAGGSASGGGFDPLTGELTSITYPRVSDLTELTNPQTSVGSHLDSALICATGGTPDTGYSCP